VFPRQKVAIFVDGCFWHRCPEHYTAPKANSGFWAEKASANVARDRDTDTRLKELGWIVLRFWEHEDLKGEAVEIVVKAVMPAGSPQDRPENRRGTIRVSPSSSGSNF